jgi:hypothetical protein
VRDDPEQSTTFHVLTVTNLALVSSYSAIVAFASVLRSQNRPHPCFRDSESEHLIFFPKKQKMIRSSLTLHNKISHLYLGNCQDSLVHSLDHFLFHSSGCSLPIFKLLFRVTPEPTAVWLLCWLSVWCSSFLTSGCRLPSEIRFTFPRSPPLRSGILTQQPLGCFVQSPILIVILILPNSTLRASNLDHLHICKSSSRQCSPFV